MSLRGMPKGKLFYKKDFILNRVTNELKTTNQIRSELNSIENLKGFSWNTIQKYLDLLSEEGKVVKVRTGNYNFWKKSKSELNEGRRNK